MLDELARVRGSHLDPALVDAFLPLAPGLQREWYDDEAEPERRAA